MYTKPNVQVNTIDETKQTCFSSPRILQLYVESLYFEHHPLFSLEHVFERQLMKLYSIHCKGVERNLVEKARTRLEVLRREKGKINDSSDHRYLESVKKIKVSRELYFKECREFRENLKQMLKVWKAIKVIRRENSYSNTSTTLIISKEKVDYAEDLKELHVNIKQVCGEILSERECDIYTIENEDNTSFNDSTNDDDILAKVQAMYADCIRPPGEPKLKIGLSHDHKISQDINNVKEDTRRKHVSKTNIYFKIVYGDDEVCRSKCVQLNDTFSCIFNELFAIQLSCVSKNISVKIYERNGSVRKARKIGTVLLDLPQNMKKSKRFKCDRGDFVNKELVCYHHEGVGVGSNVISLVENYGTHSVNSDFNTSGRVMYFSSWEEANETVQSEFQHTEVWDFNNVIQRSNIDPHDPKNKDICEYLDSVSHQRCSFNSQGNYFRYVYYTY